MAVQMRTVVQGMTTEQLQGMIAHLRDIMPTYPGFISHASGPVEGGIAVTELWDSQEAHQKWVREVIEPAMQQMGGGTPPHSEYLTIENLITR